LRAIGVGGISCGIQRLRSKSMFSVVPMARPTAICLPMPPAYGWDVGYLKSGCGRLLLANVPRRGGSLNELHIRSAGQGRCGKLVRGWVLRRRPDAFAVTAADRIIPPACGRAILVAWAVAPIARASPATGWGWVSDDMFPARSLQPDVVGGGWRFIACEIACIRPWPWDVQVNAS